MRYLATVRPTNANTIPNLLQIVVGNVFMVSTLLQLFDIFVRVSFSADPASRKRLRYREYVNMVYVNRLFVISNY